MTTSSLPAGGLPPCLYHVDVTPARRGLAPGWRVQVLDADGVAHLTESVLPWRMLGLWRSTQMGALYLGISEAYELRAGHGLSGPLVVYSSGVMIVDERPRVDAITIDVSAMAATYAAAATSRTVPAGTCPAGTCPDDLVSYGLALQLEQAQERIAELEARGEVARADLAAYDRALGAVADADVYQVALGPLLGAIDEALEILR